VSHGEQCSALQSRSSPLRVTFTSNIEMPSEIFPVRAYYAPSLVNVKEAKYNMKNDNKVNAI
jgi:hypothetical protein